MVNPVLVEVGRGRKGGGDSSLSASIHTAYDYLKEGDKVEMEKKRGKGERRRRKGFLSSRVGRRGKRYDAGSGVPRDVGEEKKRGATI